MKQSGGHAKIYSEEGVGTTVKLYFPRARAAAASAEDAPDPDDVNMAEGGSEKILLVEDDDLVRAYATDQLLSLGYAGRPSPTALMHSKR